MNVEYTDEGENYGTITFTGKARLPYKSELGGYDSTTDYNNTTDYNGPIENNEFLYENVRLGNKFCGYLSASSYDPLFVYAINPYVSPYESKLDYVPADSPYYFVRPVITVEL